MIAVTVKAIPEELVKFILKVQGDMKTEKCVGKYSQSKTIIHIIKEYKNTIEKK